MAPASISSGVAGFGADGGDGKAGGVARTAATGPAPALLGREDGRAAIALQGLCARRWLLPSSSRRSASKFAGWAANFKRAQRRGGRGAVARPGHAASVRLAMRAGFACIQQGPVGALPAVGMMATGAALRAVQQIGDQRPGAASQSLAAVQPLSTTSTSGPLPGKLGAAAQQRIGQRQDQQRRRQQAQQQQPPGRVRRASVLRLSGPAAAAAAETAMRRGSGGVTRSSHHSTGSASQRRQDPGRAETQC